MYKIQIKGKEFYNEITNEFITIPDCVLELEHSLHSLYEWESKWRKPFITDEPRTIEETISYIKCMTLNDDVNPMIYACITQKDLDKITEYIDSPQTATWFNERKKGAPSREVITAEIIYYWMVSLNIPFECDRWHLNRLITLIRVCYLKNKPPEKMSKQEAARQRMALNNKRLKKGRK